MRLIASLLVALLVLALLQPWLRRLGIGRLPGDLRFRLRGREYSVPLASTLLLTLLVTLIGRWL